MSFYERSEWNEKIQQRRSNTQHDQDDAVAWIPFYSKGCCYSCKLGLGENWDQSNPFFSWLLLLVHQPKEWLKRHRSAHWHDREEKHTRTFCSLRKKTPEKTSTQGLETAFCSHVLWLIVINSHVLSDMLLLTESDGFPSAAPPLAIDQTGKGRGGWERIDFVAVKMLGCRFSVCSHWCIVCVFSI